MYFGIKKRQITDKQYVFWSYVLPEIYLFSIAQNKMIFFAKTTSTYTEDLYTFPT
jgi:hypothetical protein